MGFFSKDKLLFGKEFSPNNVISSSSYKGSTWMPLGVASLKQINIDLAHLRWRIEQLQTKSSRLKKIRIMSITVAIIFAIVIVYFTGSIQLAAFAAVFISIPFFAINKLLKNMKVDIIKYEIAKENSWLYDPMPNDSLGRNLCQKYSSILKSGNCGKQSIEDQFWGEVVVGDISYPFYSGLYSYVVESRNRKSRSRTTHHSYMFCFKLSKKLHSQFLLSPENGLSRLFSSKEINVESIAFNKTFSFSYDGEKGEQAQHIVRSLSPIVQEKLVKLSKLRRGLSILFVDDTVMFSFPGRLLTHPQSKILGGLNLSQSDFDEIHYYLNEYSVSFTEIAKYLR